MTSNNTSEGWWFTSSYHTCVESAHNINASYSLMVSMLRYVKQDLEVVNMIQVK